MKIRRSLNENISNVRSRVWMALSLCMLNLSATYTAFVLVPGAVEYSKLHMDRRMLLMLAMELEAALVVSMCFALIKYFTEKESSLNSRVDTSDILKKMIVTTLALLLLLVLFSLMCGFMSGIIYSMLSGRLSYETIKLIVDILTGILTVILIPAVILETVSVLKSKKLIKAAAEDGLVNVRTGYLSMLRFEIVLFAVIILIAVLFHFVISSKGNMLTIIIYTIAGSIITYFSYIKAAELCK